MAFSEPTRDAVEDWTRPRGDETAKSSPERELFLAIGGLVEETSPPIDSSAILERLRQESLSLRRERFRAQLWTGAKVGSMVAALAAAVLVAVSLWPEEAALPNASEPAVASRDWDPEFFAEVEFVEESIDRFDFDFAPSDEFASVQGDLNDLADRLSRDPL